MEKLGPSLPDGLEMNFVDMAGKKKSHEVQTGRKKENSVNVITCWSDNKKCESGQGA